jgi:HSP20 family protein
MGIMDKVAALVPWRRGRQAEPAPRGDVLSLRDDFDRWLERILEEPWGPPVAGGPGWIPSANVHERDDEVVVTVEVPGLSPEDLDLMITPDGLVIRGEKREMHEEEDPDVRVTPSGMIERGQRRRTGRDERGGVYIAECRYGRFVRTVPLPPGLDVDRARARIVNGVLTVRFPRMAGRAGARRVAIQT